MTPAFSTQKAKIANTINLTTSNDASFKGATLRADDTLNLSIGNNLTLQSVQDTFTFL